MRQLIRFIPAPRLDTAAIGVLALSFIVAVAAPRDGDAASLSASAPPITVSGTVKNLNRDVELAVDPATGNGLAVWNRSKRSQGFGEIWAAELVRQDDGTYVAAEPFKVSSSKPAQRPTVEFLPEFGFYMVLWDTGFKDADKTSTDSRIIARLYEPAAAGARTSAPGELTAETPMTLGPGVNLAPGLAYYGPFSTFFEQLFYGWWSADGDGAGPELRRKKSGEDVVGRTDVGRDRHVYKGNSRRRKSKKTKWSRPRGRPVVRKKGGSLPDEILTREADRICWLRTLEKDTRRPRVQFGVACFDPATLEGTWTLLGAPARGETDEMFGALREDGDSIRAVTSAGVFDIDPAAETATTMSFSLDPRAIFGAFFGPPTESARAGAGSAPGEGFVYVHRKRGRFAYRGLTDDGDLEQESTALWKIKRKRFLEMDVLRAGDTILVAWGQAKNKRGTKSTIELGWFVPE